MVFIIFVYSGSRDALWFSTKFEKKMAALEDETPSSPLARFQRSDPLRQSKLITGNFERLLSRHL